MRCLGLVLLAVVLGGCENESGCPDHITLVVGELPETAAAGSTLEFPVEINDGCGDPLASSNPAPEVTRGGGSVAVAGQNGRFVVSWTLGRLPDKQTLLMTGAGEDTREVFATLDTPYTSEPFAEVHQFLVDEGHEGSTEDLTFTGDYVVLGAPEGLIRVDAEANVERIELSGEPLGRGWGLAADDAGTIWVVDAEAGALKRVSVEGEVTTAFTEAEGEPFRGLNYVDVGPDGRVYATDPCTGRIVRYDPATEQVDAVLTFDKGTQGGPNGLVFVGDTLYTVTENTVLLCSDAGVAPLDAPLANLYSVPVTDAGFGEITELATELGVFGDGITADTHGNLYVIADTVDGFMLDESIVWFFPAGKTTPTKFMVADGVLYANLEFGRGAFGETTLYLALLAIPGITPAESRGLQRFEVGVPGGVHPRPPR